MKKKTQRTTPRDPVSEIVGILDRLTTQAVLTQFQIGTINRRLDALEKAAAPAAKQSKGARRKP